MANLEIWSKENHIDEILPETGIQGSEDSGQEGGQFRQL